MLKRALDTIAFKLRKAGLIGDDQLIPFEEVKDFIDADADISKRIVSHLKEEWDLRAGLPPIPAEALENTQSLSAYFKEIRDREKDKSDDKPYITGEEFMARMKSMQFGTKLATITVEVSLQHYYRGIKTPTSATVHKALDDILKPRP